jgi:hypothetical protein
MKTHELTGSALDWAVAEADGTPIYRSGKTMTRMDMDGNVYWQPSTDWSQGGPIIEREGIELLCEGFGFRWVAMPQKGPEWRGPTPLIAAMRCYVAAKLGDEVNVPEGLV